MAATATSSPLSLFPLWTWSTWTRKEEASPWHSTMPGAQHSAVRLTLPVLAHTSASGSEEKLLGIPEQCTRRSENLFSLHEKIPRKFLNKLDTHQTLPKLFHPIFIFLISRNNSQVYSTYSFPIRFLINHIFFIPNPNPLVLPQKNLLKSSPTYLYPLFYYLVPI